MFNCFTLLNEPPNRNVLHRWESDTETELPERLPPRFILMNVHVTNYELFSGKKKTKINLRQIHAAWTAIQHASMNIPPAESLQWLWEECCRMSRHDGNWTHWFVYFLENSFFVFPIFCFAVNLSPTAGWSRKPKQKSDAFFGNIMWHFELSNKFDAFCYCWLKLTSGVTC